MLKIVLGLLLLGCGTVSAWADGITTADLDKLDYGQLAEINCNDPKMKDFCNKVVNDDDVEIALIVKTDEDEYDSYYVKCKTGYSCKWHDQWGGV